MDAFYQTMATFCFTLIGLWWGVLQLRHDEWIDDHHRKRLAFTVHLSFLVPGIMSLGAQVGGDIKLIWRLTFIVAAGLGLVATVLLILSGDRQPGAPRRRPTRALFTRYGRWLIALLYAAVTVVAISPALAKPLGGVSVLQVEGILLTLLVFLGVSVAWEFLAEPKG